MFCQFHGEIETARFEIAIEMDSSRGEQRKSVVEDFGAELTNKKKGEKFPLTAVRDGTSPSYKSWRLKIL